ncbi:MAG: flavodoxin family protein [Methanopyraceae archaeon]
MRVIQPIVYYFSETGNTETVARTIASALGADLVGPLTGRERADADLAFIGTPTHGFRPARPVRDFIERNDWSGVSVGLFCTYALHPGGTLRWMRRRIEDRGGRVLGELAVKGEHSALPLLARGRPNERDLRRARRFALNVLRRFKRGERD